MQENPGGLDRARECLTVPSSITMTATVTSLIKGVLTHQSDKLARYTICCIASSL